jgi:stalled ribosome alternative rescue factor ArfA
MLKKILIFSLLLLIGACGLTTTRPKLEMSLAASAYVAARDAKADTLAPNIFRKAEEYYLKAKSSYRRKYFNKAKQYAVLSKKFSEQAEYEAVRRAALENTNANTQ